MLVCVLGDSADARSAARHGCYTGVGDLGWYKLRTHWVTLDGSSGQSMFVTTFDDTTEHDSLQCEIPSSSGRRANVVLLCR